MFCCMPEYMTAECAAADADLALYVVTADLSIISCNISLMLNPVNVYQVLTAAAKPSGSYAEG